jgi:hypothetical protein
MFEEHTKLILLFVVFANQGYLVIMINPTGSTTFGQGMIPYVEKVAATTVWKVLGVVLLPFLWDLDTEFGLNLSFTSAVTFPIVWYPNPISCRTFN